MNQWHALMRKILDTGELRADRTGVGTRSLFGERCEFDLRAGFPAVTTKQLAFGQVAAELCAFLRGYDTLEQFHSVGCRIWDANARQTSGSAFRPRGEGDLGRIYGVQWRRWRSAHPLRTAPVMDETDQLRSLVEGIRRDPCGRRHLVTAWNPGELQDVCLPPCHVMFQCYAHADGGLSLWFHLRSLDVFLGMPFDVASYALLLRVLALETGRVPRRLVMTVGDAHVYLNHVEQATEVVLRSPLLSPLLELSGEATVDNFEPSMARLVDYKHHGAVPAPMNV